MSYNTLMQEQPSVISPFEAVPDTETPPSKRAVNDQNTISWTASEFIAHAKSTGWYLVLAGITVVLAVGGYFLADIMTSCIIVIVALLFGFIAARKPRELPYRIDKTGILIDKKLFYSSFPLAPTNTFIYYSLSTTR